MVDRERMSHRRLGIALLAAAGGAVAAVFAAGAAALGGTAVGAASFVTLPVDAFALLAIARSYLVVVARMALMGELGRASAFLLLLRALALEQAETMGFQIEELLFWRCLRSWL